MMYVWCIWTGIDHQGYPTRPIPVFTDSDFEFRKSKIAYNKFFLKVLIKCLWDVSSHCMVLHCVVYRSLISYLDGNKTGQALFCFYSKIVKCGFNANQNWYKIGVIKVSGGLKLEDKYFLWDVCGKRSIQFDVGNEIQTRHLFQSRCSRSHVVQLAFV